MTAPTTGEVTGETITDEQIMDLQADAEARGDHALAKTCGRALQDTHNAVWDHCRRACAANGWQWTCGGKSVSVFISDPIPGGG